MPFTTWIRDALGLWKDHKELQKLDLEIERMTTEKRERDLITCATFEQVTQFDGKYKQIELNVRRSQMPTTNCGTCGGYGYLGSGANKKTCYTCGGSGIVEKKKDPAPKAGSGGCFIATAAYESPIDPNVIFLRQFRDDVLLGSIPGRCFVKCYYTLSPGIAMIISKSPELRLIVRRSLLEPLISRLKQNEEKKR
jgi:hypothetical protein